MNDTKVKLSKLLLSNSELIHLRNLMSVQFPSNNEEETVSNLLAAHDGSTFVEKKLWNKVYQLCKKQNVAVGESAPDYIVVLTDMPKMTIVKSQPDDDYELQMLSEGLPVVENNETQEIVSTNEKTTPVPCGTNTVLCTEGGNKDCPVSNCRRVGKKNSKRK
jgi:hypothetical protein